MKLWCLSRAGVFWDGTCQWSLWNEAWKCGVPVKRKVDIFCSLSWWNWKGTWSWCGHDAGNTCLWKISPPVFWHFFLPSRWWLACWQKKNICMSNCTPKQSRFACGGEQEKKTEARRAPGVSERQDIRNSVAWQVRCSLPVDQQQSHYGPCRLLWQTLTRQCWCASSLCCETLRWKYGGSFCETLRWKYGGSWRCKPNEKLLFYSEEVKTVLALLAQFCVWCVGQQRIHSVWQVCHSETKAPLRPSGFQTGPSRSAVCRIFFQEKGSSQERTSDSVRKQCTCTQTGEVWREEESVCEP